MREERLVNRIPITPIYPDSMYQSLGVDEIPGDSTVMIRKVPCQKCGYDKFDPLGYCIQCGTHY
jgi:C4-type Zn-finger protein